jgi:hypothetical protein
LYDLIAAINAEVGVEEDDLVVACIVHLLKTQRLTYGGPLHLGDWALHTNPTRGGEMLA